MTSTNQTRPPSTSGLTLTAMTVIFAVLSQTMPAMGLIVPLPIAIAMLSGPASLAAMVCAATALFVSFIVGPLAGAHFLCQYAIVGLFFGWALKSKKSFGVTYGGAVAAKFVGIGLFMLVQLAILKFDIAAFMEPFLHMEEEMVANAEATGLFATLATSGLSAAEAELMFREAIGVMVKMIPSIYIVLFAGMVAIQLVLLYWMARRLQISLPPRPTMDALVMPIGIFVPFVIAWIILLANRYIDNQLLWIVAVNVMVVGGACMMVDGFSYSLARFKISEKSMLTKMLFLMLLLFMSVYLLVFFAVVGIFDCICDYRHLRTPRKE